MVVDIHVEERFKGPMDLLLYLIKRDEIEISDIPISHITSEYMKALKEMPEIDVEIGGEFATMASMLMEIKARLMLPPEEVDEDDEVVELDPRAGLVEALLEYKKFKEAAGELDNMMDSHSLRYPRVAPDNRAVIEETPKEEEKIDANVYELFGRMAKLMRETLAQTAATTIVATEVSTEECIDSIKDKIRIKGRISFRELLSEAASREEMVVYFIAILELVRLHEVIPFQAEDFSEIYLEAADRSGHSIRIEEASGFRRLRPLASRMKSAARILHLPGRGAESRPAVKSKAVPPFLSSLPTRKKIEKKSSFTPFMPVRCRGFASRKTGVKSPSFPSHLPQMRVTQHGLLISAMLRGMTAEFKQDHGNFQS